MNIPEAHFVNGNTLTEPFPENLQQAVFGMGCFWGAERRFWETPGVYSTAGGYAGGSVYGATYQQVCSGGTGHTEVVRVVFHNMKYGRENLVEARFSDSDRHVIGDASDRRHSGGDLCERVALRDVQSLRERGRTRGRGREAGPGGSVEQRCGADSVSFPPVSDSKPPPS